MSLRKTSKEKRTKKTIKSPSKPNSKVHAQSRVSHAENWRIELQKECGGIFFLFTSKCQRTDFVVEILIKFPNLQDLLLPPRNKHLLLACLLNFGYFLLINSLDLEENLTPPTFVCQTKTLLHIPPFPQFKIHDHYRSSKNRYMTTISRGMKIKK